jgi:hypothetical protein
MDSEKSEKSTELNRVEDRLGDAIRGNLQLALMHTEQMERCFEETINLNTSFDDARRVFGLVHLAAAITQKLGCISARVASPLYLENSENHCQHEIRMPA